MMTPKAFADELRPLFNPRHLEVTRDSVYIRQREDIDIGIKIDLVRKTVEFYGGGRSNLLTIDHAAHLVAIFDLLADSS